jgi:beta-glucosidase
MNDRVPALAAGLELEMPGTNNGNDKKIVAAVHAGELEEAVLDQAVARILKLIFKVEEALSEDYSYDALAHHTLARRVAGEGAVLLKNDSQILPLKKNTRVALIGRFAKIPRYQGAGSSLMNPSRLDNIYDEVIKIVEEDRISYAPGYSTKGDRVDENLVQEALEVAQSADVVVICAGLTDLFEVEGLDRDHMKLPPGHHGLIRAISAVHSKVVVVLSNGSPVEMPWVEEVQAILEAYLGGQAGAGAVADILYGNVNPSGKLAETFPIKLEDNPSFHYFPGGPATVEYRESIYVGYRYYDTVEKEVLFPFGHGLSYTVFEYSDLHLSQSEVKVGETLTVSLSVKNTGPTAGKETVQLYVRDVVSNVFRPFQELKGFAKVALDPEEKKHIKMNLDGRAFSYYDPNLKSWHADAGEFEIRVGSSSRDIRLTGLVVLETDESAAPLPDRDALAVYYDFLKDSPVSQADFEILYGGTMPENIVSKKGSYSLNTPIGDMRDSFVGRQLGNFMQRQIEGMIKEDPDSPTAHLMTAAVKEAPLRLMLMMGEGITREMLDALLLILNGRLLRGLASLIKAVRANRN